MLLDTLKTCLYKLWNVFFKIQAHLDKQRSLNDMEQLDDHLLDDIGFRREGDDLIPLDVKRYGEAVRNQKRYTRTKSALLKRHRGRLKAKGASG